MRQAVTASNVVHFTGEEETPLSFRFNSLSSSLLPSFVFCTVTHCTWRPEAARKCFARRVNWVCWRRGPLLTSSWSTWTVSKLSFNIPFPWNHQPWDKVRLLASTHMYTQSYRSWEHAVIWTRVSGGHRPQVCLFIGWQKHKGGVGERTKGQGHGFYPALSWASLVKYNFYEIRLARGGT